MKKIVIFIMVALIAVFTLSPALCEAPDAPPQVFAPLKPEGLDNLENTESPNAEIDLTDIKWLSTYLDAVIVGICVVIGVLIKHCTPLNSRYIPLIVALVGLIVSVWMHWQDGVTPHMILGGLFSGLASTGFHQVFKQMFFENDT